MKSMHVVAATAPRSAGLAVVAGSLLALLALSVLALWATPAARAASGDLAWQRVYDGPSHSSDSYYTTAGAPNGGIYAAGATGNPGDVLVARYDATGQRLWLHAYDGPSHLSDSAHDAVSDRYGNLVVVGAADDAKIVVIKYGPGGKRRWVRIYHDPQSTGENATNVAVDAAGAIYVAGYRLASATEDDIVLIKYSPSGRRLWVRRFVSPGEWTDPGDIAIDGAGDVYVTGGAGSSYESTDVVTLKYDSTGHRRWVKRWDGPGGSYDWGEALTVSAAGAAYVAADATGTTTDRDAAVLKYSPAGALKWTRTQTSDGAFQDYYRDIVVMGDGDVAAVGSIYGGAGHGPDVLLVRLSPGGQTRWTRAYNGPDGLPDEGRHVARGALGSVFVAGTSSGLTTSYDMLVLKYSGSGGLAWDRRYAGKGGSDQQTMESLSFNAGVYVAGYQAGTPASDAVLLKYRP